MSKKQKPAPLDRQALHRKVDDILSRACAKWMPYYARWSGSLILVPCQGLPAPACVDKYLRCYYDADFMATVDVDMGAYVFLHESLHPFLRHWERLEAIVEDTKAPMVQEISNLAGDCEIWTVLDQVVFESQGGNGKSKLPELPDLAGSPAKLQLPPNKTFEEWFWLLWERNPTIETEQVEVTVLGQYGQPDKTVQCESRTMNLPMPDGTSLKLPLGIHGSGADGQEKPFEQGQPNKDAPGLSPTQQRTVRRYMAERIEESDGRGEIGAFLQRYCKEIIEPKTNWISSWLINCQRAVRYVPGIGAYTFRRPQRKPGFGGLRLPRSVAPVPDIVFICDTSGSMGERDLGMALGATKRAMNSLHLDQVRFYSGDTDAKSCQRIFGVGNVQLMGGGGTAMDQVIHSVLEKGPDPSLVVCISDGITPWPEKQIRPKLLIGLTSDPGANWPTPSWATVVHLYRS